MKKNEIFTFAFIMVLLFSCMTAMVVGCALNIKTQIAEKEQIDLAKQEIVAEYGFDPVLWIEVEKIDNREDRDDFYIFTCLVDEGELVEYRFAVVIREVNDEIDVDTWQIKEG